MRGWRRSYDSDQCAILPEFRLVGIPATAQWSAAPALSRSAADRRAAGGHGAVARRVVPGRLSAWADRRVVDHRNALAAGRRGVAPGLDGWPLGLGYLAVVVGVCSAGGGALSRFHGCGHAGHLQLGLLAPVADRADWRIDAGTSAAGQLVGCLHADVGNAGFHPRYQGLGKLLGLSDRPLRRALRHCHAAGQRGWCHAPVAAWRAHAGPAVGGRVGLNPSAALKRPVDWRCAWPWRVFPIPDRWRLPRSVAAENKLPDSQSTLPAGCFSAVHLVAG